MGSISKAVGTKVALGFNNSVSYMCIYSKVVTEVFEADAKVSGCRGTIAKGGSVSPLQPNKVSWYGIVCIMHCKIAPLTKLSVDFVTLWQG